MHRGTVGPYLRSGLAILFLVLFFPGPSAGLDHAASGTGPGMASNPGLSVSPPSPAGVSPAVRDLRVDTSEPSSYIETIPRQNPLRNEPDAGRRGTWNRMGVSVDPRIPSAGATLRSAPALDLSFDATGNPIACDGCAPPDPNGDVGPNHYIHMVNATKVAIYDKAGALLSGPFNLGTLWGGGVCTENFGDPIVLYDSLADRWLLSQFAEPNHLCVALSQTADPTGAYHTYTFDVGSFPDYFKFGVWPDGYYMSANEETYTAYAFDRASMLSGAAVSYVKFTGQTNLLLPADLDGPTPPADGAPAPFYTFKDGSFHGGSDRLEVFELHVDWATPANSTFALAASLPIADFTYTPCGFFNFDCIRQPGTAQRVDAIAEWPMFRFPYRNMGTHQALVGTFTVGGGLGEAGAAIRWFELRSTGSGWTLYQEGTHDPGDGHDRWTPSIAMDKSGNIALGYSVSSSTIHPSIRYAMRRPGDPPGTLQAEAVMIAPEGSQTGTNRWGDYSSMAVDPTDDCSFWYTNEYYKVDSFSQWTTRVGVFKDPGCGAAPRPLLPAVPLLLLD